MRIAFMGTPDFAVAVLAAVLDAGHEVAAVYAQPPKPRGRGKTVQPSPVHAFAESRGLAVRTPGSMRDPEAVATFQSLQADAAVVAAYGQILVREVLEAPRLGSFNLHASLLPRWRGAAPIQRAIMAGDEVTGVQVMRMTEGLDEGPVLLGEVVPIEFDDTAGSLHDKLAAAAARLTPRALELLARGEAVERPQPTEGATYARKVRPEEARIDWSRPAVEVDRHIRGLSPFPGAWFELEGARIKALLSRPSAKSGPPGEALDDAGLVACGEGAVRLLRLQREGRAAQDAESFLRGRPIPAGVQLG
jgi:methionyl-tRNA formyltransferase